MRLPLLKLICVREANAALLYALMAPVLLGCVGGGVNYGMLIGERARLQAIADAAATGVAKELRLASTASATIEQSARTMALSQLGGDTTKYDVTAQVLDARSALRVSISANVEDKVPLPFLGSDWGVSVRATARVTAGPPLCVLALEAADPGAISLSDRAKITGRSCSVMSNSTNAGGLSAVDSSLLQASFICSAGGLMGSSFNFAPAPVTDCPAVRDPLSSRPEPTVGIGCTENNKVTFVGVVVLAPGTYCGGLRISPGSIVTLLPGTYVIKDGPLVIEDLAVVTGVNVGFFLKGATATLSFARLSVINLTAPLTGPLAGFLAYESRDAPDLREHRISSDTALLLLGTVYLPRGRLVIDSTQPLALRSAYTIIVARRLELSSTPDLVLNTDYDKTDVPVPDGVGPGIGTVRLSE